MVIAEIFSLLLYVLSLVILHDYFGKNFNTIPLSSFKKKSSIFNSRLGLHLVIRIPVESTCDHISLMFAFVYYKIFAKKILTTCLFEIILKGWD